jgi:hypothetical protein
VPCPQPEPGQYREQHRCGDGERPSSRTGGRRDAGAYHGEHQDLDQERDAAARVLAPVQFIVEAAVGPGDPNEREHHGELAEPAPGQMPGQTPGGLGDQHDHG